MGAWGVGMQANDDAMDAICTIEDEWEGKRSYKILAWAMERFKGDQTDGWMRAMLLGTADWLMDQKVSMYRSRKLLREVVELEKNSDAGWKDDEDRQAALDNFLKRAIGEGFDEEAHARDNEGLMTKMGKFLGGQNA